MSLGCVVKLISKGIGQNIDDGNDDCGGSLAVVVGVVGSGFDARGEADDATETTRRALSIDFLSEEIFDSIAA